MTTEDEKLYALKYKIFCLEASLIKILEGFESCISGGNGALDKDLDAVNTARSLLGIKKKDYL